MLKLKTKKTKTPELTVPAETPLTPDLNPEPSTPPETITEPAPDLEAPSESFSADHPPTHFDHLIGEAEEQAEQESAAADGLLTSEEFHFAWCELTGLASDFTGLASLEDQPGDAKTKCLTDMVHRRASRSKYLRWILQPQSGWMADIGIVVVYGMGKRRALIEEVNHKRRANPPAPEEKQQAAPQQPREDGEPDPAQAAALAGA